MRLLAFAFTIVFVWTEPKKTTTATGTSLIKRFNEQDNGSARAL